MSNEINLKRRIIRKIDTLDSDKLSELFVWLGLNEEDDLILAKQRNLALTGVWKNIPDLVFNSILKEIYQNRKSKKL